jgi:hypothetical protein
VPERVKRRSTNVGSLLEGIETTPASASSKAKAGGSEAAKTVKLAIAIGGLLIGGALIAWNMGVFGNDKPGAREIDPNVPPEVAGATGPQIVKPTNNTPATTQPNKPKSSINFH